MSVHQNLWPFIKSENNIFICKSCVHSISCIFGFICFPHAFSISSISPVWAPNGTLGTFPSFASSNKSLTWLIDFWLSVLSFESCSADGFVVFHYLVLLQDFSFLLKNCFVHFMIFRGWICFLFSSVPLHAANANVHVKARNNITILKYTFIILPLLYFIHFDNQPDAKYSIN